MERKRELKQQFKELKVEAGVYEIKNTINQKIFISSTRNLKTLNGRKFELEAGSSTNKALQKEWDEFGKEAFQFTVLERLKKPETGFFDEKRALQKLEENWLAKKQPYGEKGYNQPK
ncbi:GIY-YIG nuclease family protein [Domibacillus robiginosus]|uniref:GIY-YIG nuclease family protein n=1 Tax=Domibacillus robiginosus TaxID=1071054 RepID=UPI00067B22BD|nr:GIY-YIG nuclease family protein [Domibacillus robiginosus]